MSSFSDAARKRKANGSLPRVSGMFSVEEQKRRRSRQVGGGATNAGISDPVAPQSNIALTVQYTLDKPHVSPLDSCYAEPSDDPKLHKASRGDILYTIPSDYHSRYAGMTTMTTQFPTVHATVNGIKDDTQGQFVGIATNVQDLDNENRSLTGACNMSGTASTLNLGGETLPILSYVAMVLKPTVVVDPDGHVTPAITAPGKPPGAFYPSLVPIRDTDVVRHFRYIEHIMREKMNSEDSRAFLADLNGFTVEDPSINDMIPSERKYAMLIGAWIFYLEHRFEKPEAIDGLVAQLQDYHTKEAKIAAKYNEQSVMTNDMGQRHPCQDFYKANSEYSNKFDPANPDRFRNALKALDQWTHETIQELVAEQSAFQRSCIIGITTTHSEPGSQADFVLGRA